MKTIKTHFKRHGSGNWLEIKGLEDSKYYIEFNYHNGNKGNFLHVKEDISVMKEWGGKQYKETKAKTILYTELEKLDYDLIQKEINTVLTDIQIELEHFIESYHIPQKEHTEDRDIINDVDVTGMTTNEVINSTNIQLDDYFKTWRLPEKVNEYLIDPNEDILSMDFKELYSLIHWNCHKQDFEATFENAIL